MSPGSGHLHHQDLGVRTIVIGPPAPAGSLVYPSQKIPLTLVTLVGPFTQGLPILSVSFSPFLATCTMACPIHSSPTRGV
jgi:hypothetical protein